MKIFSLATVIPLLIATLSSGQAQAVTFTERNDAGESIDTAQIISGGTLPLTSISGKLSGDADLFQIFLTGGQTFSATTINLDTLIGLPTDDLLGSPSDLLADPQLFLFDSFGKGIYANDDSSTSLQPILSSDGFSPTESGIYYLAISSSGYNPISAEGRIFPNDPSDGVFGATTVDGEKSKLTGFDGTSTTSGRYTIELTGVQTAAKSVPEPSSMLSILALGTLGIVSRLKDKKKHEEVTKL